MLSPVYAPVAADEGSPGREKGLSTTTPRIRKKPDSILGLIFCPFPLAVVGLYVFPPVTLHVGLTMSRLSPRVLHFRLLKMLLALKQPHSLLFAHSLLPHNTEELVQVSSHQYLVETVTSARSLIMSSQESNHDST